MGVIVKNTKLFFGLTAVVFLSVSSGYAMENGDVYRKFTDVNLEKLLEDPEKCISCLDLLINDLLLLERKVANADTVPLLYPDTCTIYRLTQEGKSLDVAKKKLVELREDVEKHKALLFKKVAQWNEFSDESVDFLTSYSVVKQWFENSDVKQWFEKIEKELVEILKAAKEFEPELLGYMKDSSEEELSDEDAEKLLRLN